MTSTPLYVIAPISVPGGDRAWIDALRRDHDPQAGLIEPHVTFVFGVRGLRPDAMVAHVTRITATTPPITFHLNRAETVRDDTGVISHVFLIPSQGRAQMRQLHGALYAGRLAPERRADIPYVPHVIVAAMADHARAEHLVAEISQAGVSIRGRLQRLDIVAFDGRTLKRLQSLQFRPPGRPD